MLTRSRFGFFANENSDVGVKDSVIGIPKGKSIITNRSRAALGDIKNKACDIEKAPERNKITKKDKQVEKKCENICDMSVDEVSNLTQDQNDGIKKFRLQRKNIRDCCLSKKEAGLFLNVDYNDFSDTATVYPYAETIYNYLQNRELKVQPLFLEFMSLNNEVTPRMRYILINWLVQVHYSYKLQPETLYLSVALLDRYLLKNLANLSKDRFQLIGIASLFIAAKFEEMYPPEISDFSSISNNAYSKSDIRNSEQEILQSLDFFLSIPIPLVFLRRLSRAIDADRTMHNLAKYLLELTIQESDLAYLPGNLRSVVALCLARALSMETTDLENAWSDKLSYLSGYNLDDIRPYIRILARAVYRQNSPSKYRAIYNKYRTDDFYGRVAALPQLCSSLMETLADLKFDSDGEINS